MGLKLIHSSTFPIHKSSKPIAKLTLIQGDKDIPQLWASDQQVFPLPKIMPPSLVCHKCGDSDEFVWINTNSIYCFNCNLTSIQAHK